MQPTDQLTLAPAPPGTPDAECCRGLCADGRDTGLLIDGERMLWQLQCGPLRLFATQCFYYDNLDHWIYLLSPDDRILDRLTLPIYVYDMQDLRIESDTRIGFGFGESTDRWTVDLHPDGYWSFAPRAIYYRGSRFLFRRRYLTARCDRGGSRGSGQV